MHYDPPAAGLQWPSHDSGKPSFKLEHLTKANQIEHGDAHDAMADVRATLGLAAQIRRAQPQLFAYALSLRNKNQVAKMIDPLAGKPFVHSSARIPAERGCTTVMMPICKHPVNPKSVLCIDLNKSVEDVLNLPADQLADRLFTPAKDLPEGVERISVKSVASNKVPFVAPMGVLKNADLDRIQLDMDRCMENASLLSAAPGLAEKIASLFGPYDDSATDDPDLMIYSGSFFDASDKRQMREIHSCPPEDLATRQVSFHDGRLDEMLFRYRARNYPESLTADEAQRWDQFRSHRLLAADTPATLNFESYQALLAAWRERPDLQPQQQEVLDQLDAWPLEIGIPGMISNT
jgi:exodeoxyribonuclease-1